MAIAPELTFPILVGGALLDSMTPCVIGVLILLMTVLMRQKDKRILVRNGLIYVSAVYLTYFIAGVTLLKIFTLTRETVTIANYFYLGLGGLIGFFGLLEVKDFFWYGRWVSLGIFPRFISTMEGYVERTGQSPIAAFLFGIFVTLIELPCTGAPYLAVLTLMSFMAFSKALPLLVVYNLVFVLPLIFIISLAYVGVRVKKIEKWRRVNRRGIRLFIGVFLLALSILTFYIISRQYALIFSGIEIVLVLLMYILWKLKIV